jgi:hypothetical protein
MSSCASSSSRAISCSSPRPSPPASTTTSTPGYCFASQPCAVLEVPPSSLTYTPLAPPTNGGRQVDALNSKWKDNVGNNILPTIPELDLVFEDPTVRGPANDVRLLSSPAPILTLTFSGVSRRATERVGSGLHDARTQALPRPVCELPAPSFRRRHSCLTVAIVRCDKGAPDREPKIGTRTATGASTRYDTTTRGSSFIPPST